MRKPGFDAEIEFPIVQFEDAVALAVVNQGAVVKLGGSQAHGVVGGRREQQKVFITT